jgi:hypothetical protein
MFKNWIPMEWSPVQLHWVHEISQSALALAVATLGVVILLELASISRLRRAMDSHLQRVLEQLEQLMEARSQTPAVALRPQPPPAPEAAVTCAPPALGAGEARLLAALAAARGRQGPGGGTAGR